MTRQSPDPRNAADAQHTTALPRRPAADGDSTPGRNSEYDDDAARRSRTASDRNTPAQPIYQETTVLRRPDASVPRSNVPGSGRAAAGAWSDPRADAASDSTAGRNYREAGGSPRVDTDRDGRETRRRARDGSHLPPYAGPSYPGPGYPGTGYPGAAYPGSERQQPGAGAEPSGRAGGPIPPRGLQRQPRKLTVTRVAALRSRELTHRGLEKFHGAVSADGAGQSGLGHLTYAVMANYAVDAALAVALANTLFFAAAKAESTGKVLLYLLLTVAPFAVIAPLIGPLLDKLQRGRRFALAASSVGRTVLAIVMALKFDSWVIYPCALGMLVLSKGFGVLKAALTPRVLPEAITLVKTNSRMSVFGLIAGGVSGGIAAGIAALTTSAGALWFTAACGLVGAWLCLRIPSWVESTEGEVPIQHTGAILRPGSTRVTEKRRELPRSVATALWANSVIRIETGFLALFIAFVIKTRYQPTETTTPGVALGAATNHQGWMQLLVLGAVGAAAGVGGFLGNALGARLPLRAPEAVTFWCLGGVLVSVVTAFALPGLITAGVVALVGSTASSLAKVCLDATIQDGLPEVSRASAFGRSESILQLNWVFGGVIGLLIGGVWALGGNAVYQVGFGILGLLLIAGTSQTVAIRLGRSLIPPIHLPHRHRAVTAAGAAWPATNQPGVYPGGPTARRTTRRVRGEKVSQRRAGQPARAANPADPAASRRTRKAGRPR
ncbi:MAG: hypothetical protein BGO26_09930 [Actinobacteria bacterium 69-20]|nr:MFS transporter [Actinomycetota bacterium]OJV23225.1 MAG: hypothetical protein BGO26_09930 [Actinobacteria bacterium 69-20]